MSSTLPTRRCLGIRNASDAFKLFEAVRIGRLPLIRQRLSQTERDNLDVGQIFVWAESSAADGLERWTDGRKWSPSKSRDVFLIYEERDEPSPEEKVEKAAQRISRFFSNPTQENEDLVGIFAVSVPNFRERPPKKNGLVKQTFSAWVRDPNSGTRTKWHMSAYLSSNGWGNLPFVDEDPVLRDMHVRPDVFECCTGPRKHRKPSVGTARPCRPSVTSPEGRTRMAGGAHDAENALRLEWTPPLIPRLQSTPSLSSGSSTSSPETSVICLPSPPMTPAGTYTLPGLGPPLLYHSTSSPSNRHRPLSPSVQLINPYPMNPSHSQTARSSGLPSRNINPPHTQNHYHNYQKEGASVFHLPSLSELADQSRYSTRTDIDTRTLSAFRPSL